MNKHSGSDKRKMHDPDGKIIPSLRFQQKNRGLATRKFRIPIIFIILGFIIGIFILITPIQPGLQVSVSATDSTQQLSRLPTFTLPPAPTDLHGGGIIFTCTRSDIHQLCMINADGSGFGRLTNHNAHDYYPSFLPSGGSILFASNRNGSFDIYLWVLSIDKLYQLTQNIGNAFAPSFSPDGKKILFINGIENGGTALWVMENTGKNPTILFSSESAIVNAAWSPDGRTIAMVISSSPMDEFSLYFLELDNNISSPRRLLLDSSGITGSLDWSPDGLFLLYCAGLQGEKDIFRYDISFGAVTQLTHGGNNAAAVYSPDGEWIAYNSLRNNDQADLFIMRADGTYQRQLTDDPEPDWQPQWEP